MQILRTPESRFGGLPDFAYPPCYTELDGVRMCHVESGGGPIVLLLHGEPTWSFLYRSMIPLLAAAGLRAIAPDLIGFGRSDKPAAISDYTYARQVEWVRRWIEKNDLTAMTLFCQDWGALIGLRLAAEHPARFDRIVVANGFLPTAEREVPLGFRLWRTFARFTPVFPASRIVQVGTVTRLPRNVLAGYDAPFPEEAYKKGARALPLLVPTAPSDPAVPANREAWKRLREWTKPFLTAFGKRDPILGRADRVLQRHVPGASGQPHRQLHGAGHFVQEDAGPELASIIVEFIRST